MEKRRLDLKSLRDAVASLGDALDVVNNHAWFDAQSDQVQRMLIAGVIQNFELVYEIGFKMLKRRVELDAASPADVDQNDFRDVLRVAAEKGIVADVEAWFGYRKMRNITAYTYDQKKAMEVYQGAQRFISDARALLAVLEARNA